VAVAAVVGEMVQRREISRKRRSEILRRQCASMAWDHLSGAPSRPPVTPEASEELARLAKRVLQGINPSREPLAELGAPIVFSLAEDGLRSFAAWAVDMFAARTLIVWSGWANRSPMSPGRHSGQPSGLRLKPASTTRMRGQPRESQTLSEIGNEPRSGEPASGATDPPESDNSRLAPPISPSPPRSGGHPRRSLGLPARESTSPPQSGGIEPSG
jgi:hypothetical protein